jgi:hypothetical protein
MHQEVNLMDLNAIPDVTMLALLTFITGLLPSGGGNRGMGSAPDPNWHYPID